MCSTCFLSKRTEGGKCVCTLKKRYLDQWIRLECDIKDMKAWQRKMKPLMKKESDEEREVQVKCECGGVSRRDHCQDFMRLMP